MSGWKGKVPLRGPSRVPRSRSREHAWTPPFFPSLHRAHPCYQRRLPYSRLCVFSLRKRRALATVLGRAGWGEVPNEADTFSKPIAATPARQAHSAMISLTLTRHGPCFGDLRDLGSLPGRFGPYPGAVLPRNRLFRTTLILGILGKVGRSVRNHSPHASRCASKASRFTGPDASSPHTSGYAGSLRIRSAVVNLVPAGIVILTHCPRGPPPAPDNDAVRLGSRVCDVLRRRGLNVGDDARGRAADGSAENAARRITPRSGWSIDCHSRKRSRG